MLPAHRVIGHKEYGNTGHPGRKSDPVYDMNWRRTSVANFTPRITQEEDDMTPAQAAQLAEIHAKTVGVKLPLVGRPGPEVDDLYGHVLNADATSRAALAAVKGLSDKLDTVIAALGAKDPQ